MRDKRFLRASLLVLLTLTLSAASASAQNRLKVMTWNIGGGPCHARVADMRPFAEEMRAKNPDVIALQEVHYDQAYALAHYMQPAKPFYLQFVWAQRCVSKTRPSIFDYGNAIISRFPIRAEGGTFDGGFEVSPDPARAANGNPEYIKVAEASVQLPNGQWVRVYSAHLTGNNGPPANASLQASQTLTHILINDQRSYGQPRTILMGDFNTYPATGPCATSKAGYTQYRQLTHWWWDSPQFTDAWTMKPYDPGDVCGYTISPRNVPNPYARYDYIFLRNTGGFKVNRMERVKTRQRLSDHFPVYAELSF
ncbi:MAG TPA: endonuclease/exonuclease/phosphatase family protein [Pyrinomonadaceae bacterium]|nr:endonuclease/exonuclease/phosphatase family protein [Pyrinomonadaceae bacterium]